MNEWMNEWMKVLFLLSSTAFINEKGKWFECIKTRLSIMLNTRVDNVILDWINGL